MSADLVVTAVALVAGTWSAARARAAVARARRDRVRAADLRDVNRTLQHALIAYRRRAAHWQETAELAEHEHDMAMLNTGFGPTFVDVRSLPDTRERTR